MDSMAPAAPRLCPVMDFSAVSAGSRPLSPNTARTALASAASPGSVAVPLALKKATSPGETPPSLSAARTARALPAPSGSGCTMW